MDTNPLVSIVIPSFNQANFIEQAILSIITQSYNNVECIVIDAASKDGTIEILNKYSNKIHWISEPDKGESDGINKGILMCHGEIYGRVNSDDMLASGAVKKVAENFLLHPEVDVVYGDCVLIDENGNSYRSRSFKVIHEFTFRKMLRIWYGILPAPAVFMKKSVLDDIGVQDLSLNHAADYDLWCRIAQKGYRFKYLAEVLAMFRVHAEQKSNLIKKHHSEILRVTKKYGSWIDILFTRSHLGYLSLLTCIGRFKRAILSIKKS